MFRAFWPPEAKVAEDLGDKNLFSLVCLWKCGLNLQQYIFLIFFSCLILLICLNFNSQSQVFKILDQCRYFNIFSCLKL